MEIRTSVSFRNIWKNSPLAHGPAGKRAPRDDLAKIPRLVSAYYTHNPLTIVRYLSVRFIPVKYRPINLPIRMAEKNTPRVASKMAVVRIEGAAGMISP